MTTTVADVDRFLYFLDLPAKKSMYLTMLLILYTSPVCILPSDAVEVIATTLNGCVLSLQCFDTVGWAAGRVFGL